MNPTLQRYLLSTAITFVSTFMVVLGTNLPSALSGQTLTFALIGSIIMIAMRATVKAVGENMVGGHGDLPSITASVPAQEAAPIPAQV